MVKHQNEKVVNGSMFEFVQNGGGGGVIKIMINIGYQIWGNILKQCQRARYDELYIAFVMIEYISFKEEEWLSVGQPCLC